MVFSMALVYRIQYGSMDTVLYILLYRIQYGFTGFSSAWFYRIQYGSTGFSMALQDSIWLLEDSGCMASG
jgi:hypothetical protein